MGLGAGRSTSVRLGTVAQVNVYTRPPSSPVAQASPPVPTISEEQAMKAVQVRRSRLSALVLGVLVLIGLAVPDARAQMGMGMAPTQFSAPINRRSLDEYAKILSLTHEQKEAVKSLYDGYVASHADTMKEMQKVFQDAQEKMQDTGDFKVYQKEMPKKMQAISAKVEKLETGFYEDTKTLLSAEQQGNWPKVERHR